MNDELRLVVRAFNGAVVDGRAEVVEDVGSFDCPECPYDLAYMAGNIWEWTRSAYEPYPYDPADGREDLSGLSRSRVLRGGAFLVTVDLVRAAYRYRLNPVDRDDFLGFRVVVSPF